MKTETQLTTCANLIHGCLKGNRIQDMTLAIDAFDEIMQKLDDGSTTIDHPLIVTLELFKTFSSEKFIVIEEAVQYAFIRIFHAMFDHVLLRNIEDDYQTLYGKTTSNFTEGLEQFLHTEPSPRIQFHCESIIEAIKTVRTNANELRKYLESAWTVLTSALSDPIQCIPNLIKLFIDLSKNWQGTWFADVLFVRQLTTLAMQGQDVLTTVQQTLVQNKKGNWHLLYAALELLTTVSKSGKTNELMKQAFLGLENLPGIIAYASFKEFSFQNNWRIRLKVAESCIELMGHQEDLEIRQKAIDLLITRKILETDARVQKTLKKTEHVPNFKSAAQARWQAQRDLVVNQLEKQVDMIEQLSQTHHQMQSMHGNTEEIAKILKTEQQSLGIMVQQLQDFGREIGESIHLTKKISDQIQLMHQDIAQIQTSVSDIQASNEHQTSLLEDLHQKADHILEKPSEIYHDSPVDKSTTNVVTPTIKGNKNTFFGTVGQGDTHINIGTSNAAGFVQEGMRLLALGMQQKEERKKNWNKMATISFESAMEMFKKALDEAPRDQEITKKYAEALFWKGWCYLAPAYNEEKEAHEACTLIYNAFCLDATLLNKYKDIYGHFKVYGDYLKGSRLIIYAARTGHIELFTMLMKQKVHLDLGEDYIRGGYAYSRDSVVRVAFRFAQLEIIQLLKKDIDFSNTPEALIGAVASDRADKLWLNEIRKLLQLIPVNVVVHDEIPIMQAVACRRKVITEFLIEQGADVSFINKKGSLLHAACERKAYDVIQVLLENGAGQAINLKSEEDQDVPLSLLCNKLYLPPPDQRLTQIDTIKLMLRYGAKDDFSNIHSSALRELINEGQFQEAECLIRAGISVNQKYSDGESFLYRFISYTKADFISEENYNCLNFLIKNGAVMNMSSDEKKRAKRLYPLAYDYVQTQIKQRKKAKTGDAQSTLFNARSPLLPNSNTDNSKSSCCLIV